MFSRVVSGVTRPKRILSVFLGVVAVLVLTGAAPLMWAQEGDDDEEDEATIPFDEALMRIETNATDGDAGIQIFLDAEAWKEIEITNPAGKIFEVEGRGNLEGFGLTELFIESNEPSFDELPLADMLALFPAGEYELEGETVQGDELEGVATLTHDIPCGPVIISPQEDEEIDLESTDLVIEWEEVTGKLNPMTAECEADSPVIVAYQVVVEKDEEEERLRVFSFDMLDTDRRVTLPKELLEPGKDYKVEILAIEQSGNQTITEVPFATVEE